MPLSQTTARTWYDFALQQIAAEAYLEDIGSGDRSGLLERLQLGNNDLRQFVYVDGVQRPNSRFGQYPQAHTTPVFPGSTRLTESQADYFANTWEVVHQHANDPSGFSATLLKHRETGEYTLAFRSTEFFRQEDGGDFQRDAAGADAGIFSGGFALAQLSAMERLYAGLRSSGALPGGVQVNVTGYSLGGHLATVFTELHPQDVAHTYLFNATDKNEVRASIGSIHQLIAAYDAILADPAYAVASGLIAEPVDSGGAESNVAHALYQTAAASAPVYWAAKDNAYLTARERWAGFVLDAHTRGGFAASIDARGGISPLAEAKITYLYGMGSNHDETFVTNSALTPRPFKEKTRVLIEDQPDIYGDLTAQQTGSEARSGDFYRTHSITLIVLDMRPHHTFVIVEEAQSEPAQTALAGQSWNGRPLRCEVAKA